MRVDVDGVCFRRGGREVLRNVSFRLEPQVTVLLGANGAGKTTLLRMVAGLVRPSSGKIYGTSFEGHARPRIKVGYLPQAPRPVRGLTVAQYLKYFAFLKGLTYSETHAALRTLIPVLGLEDERNLRTHRLSGGMLRRLGIGAAVIGDPDVILLDEPTAGLDPEQRIRMRELIATLRARVPVLVSTHLAEDAAHIADSLVILNEGKLTSMIDMQPRLRNRAVHASEIEQAFMTVVRT